MTSDANFLGERNDLCSWGLFDNSNCDADLDLCVAQAGNGIILMVSTHYHCWCLRYTDILVGWAPQVSDLRVRIIYPFADMVPFEISWGQ